MWLIGIQGGRLFWSQDVDLSWTLKLWVLYTYWGPFIVRLCDNPDFQKQLAGPIASEALLPRYRDSCAMYDNIEHNIHQSNNNVA